MTTVRTSIATLQPVLGVSMSQLLLWSATVVGLLAVAMTNPYGIGTLNLTLGAAVVMLALLPLSRWLAPDANRSLPMLVVHGLFFAICFGAGGFVIAPPRFVALVQVSDSEYTQALLGALLSWTMIVAGYALGGRSRLRWEQGLLHVEVPAATRLVATLIYPLSIAIAVFTNRSDQVEWRQIPLIAHMFLFTWTLHAAWSGRLTPAHRRMITFVAIPLEFLLLGGLAEGNLVGFLTYGLVIGVTYAETHRRVPVGAAIAVVLLFAVFTPVKQEYRAATWGASTGYAKMGPVEGVLQFSTMAWQAVAQGEFLGNPDTFEVIYTRLHHLHIVAAVIADTPSNQPYRFGSTLLPLLTKWIPRVLWPGKPLEDLGNRWAQDYAFLGRDDTATSYNLPWLAEMYMNGGWLGVIIISLAVGALMGWLRQWMLVEQPSSSYYAYSYMVASAFFFPESNMSAQLGGLIPLTAIALSIVIALKHVAGRRADTKPKRGYAPYHTSASSGLTT